MTAYVIAVVGLYLIVAAMNVAGIKQAQTRRQRLTSAALFSFALMLAAWSAMNLKG